MHFNMCWLQVPGKHAIRGFEDTPNRSGRSVGGQISVESLVHKAAGQQGLKKGVLFSGGAYMPGLLGPLS